MIILSLYSHTLNGGGFLSLLYKEVDDFEAYAYHQKQFKKVTKKDLLGKWNLFFFYPADFTFVCPTELEDLQEKYQEFKKVNCEVYAISTDTHFAHKTWHDISDNISTSQYPEVDLMIRTSLDYRLSNFLLWQLSYSELYFVDCYWPDFDEKQFEIAIKDYSERQRRFGGLK